MSTLQHKFEMFPIGFYHIDYSQKYTAHQLSTGLLEDFH